jgi:hypothetical protein
MEHIERDFKVGDIYPLFRGPGKPYKIHVVAVVEDSMIVFRWYGRHKKWWHYEIEHRNLLSLLIARAEEYGLPPSQLKDAADNICKGCGRKIEDHPDYGLPDPVAHDDYR